MRRVKVILVVLMIYFIAPSMQAQNTDNTDQAVLDFLNLKFGMFIHYNMGTYQAQQWAYPFHDPKDFNLQNWIVISGLKLRNQQE